MILIGASGHAKVILDILEKSGVEILFLLDKDPTIKELLGYKVKLDEEYVYDNNQEYLISIGSNLIRKNIAEKLILNYGWGIHPSVILGDDVSVGQGTVLMAGSIVNSSTSIGNHCIINTSASIDHDCQLDDFVHISPNATLCGGIEVGEGSQIGAGSVVIPNLKIGKWVTVGAGSVVIENVPDGATVVGNPARIIKRSND